MTIARIEDVVAGFQAAGRDHADLFRTKASILAADLTVSIPSDYPTINDAIQTLLSLWPVNGAKIQINIESGHVITSAFALTEGQHADHFRITSDDPIVYANAQNIGDRVFFSTAGAFGYAICARAPIWDILVDFQNSGPADAKGLVIAGPGASIDFMPGKGMRNFGNRLALAGPEPSQYGFGLLLWNCAEGRLNFAEITGSAQRNLWASRNARYTAAEANLSGAQGRSGPEPYDNPNHANVYTTRGSWGNLEYANLSNSAGRGVISARSYINAEGADVRNNADQDLWVIRGGQLNAYGTRTTNSPETVFPFTPQPSDCGGIQELNSWTGFGSILSEQQQSWPNRQFLSNGGVNWIVTRDIAGIMVVQSRAPVTFSFQNADRLLAAISFPIPMFNGEYFAEVSDITTSRPELRGVFDVVAFSKVGAGCDLTLWSNAAFTSGDSATGFVRVTGRWR